MHSAVGGTLPFAMLLNQCQKAGGSWGHSARGSLDQCWAGVEPHGSAGAPASPPLGNGSCPLETPAESRASPTCHQERFSKRALRDHARPFPLSLRAHPLGSLGFVLHICSCAPMGQTLGFGRDSQLYRNLKILLPLLLVILRLADVFNHSIASL